MKELSKAYEPHAVEDRWIQTWIDKNLFSPNSSNKSSLAYSIVIPPPNVTGSLHMGHALNNTLQDILVRYHRMQGDHTLWVVGTDHAGIATQNVVEKQLAAEGKSRFDLGRDKFIERVWQWRKESGGIIINQLKRLGASCDYANERFTMDEGLSAAVRKVFVQLYHEGLIYRGLRLINWCPRCHTALSDLEVEHEEQKGHLWHIKYGGLVVATTRPETMLGDTAVAVNPSDVRYKDWIGKKVVLPLVNREIPVIADEYVDHNFGSGVVKITPAHDFNDFEIGNRHGLPRINILTEDGKINANGGSYVGMTIHTARKKVVEDLEALELLEKVEPYTNAVGHCYRCKAVVEPSLSPQWYVKTKPLAAPAIEAVRKGKTKFIPEHWSKTYFNWMENIQDWCISRQIWWGHQIPAWYCDKKCNPVVAEQPPKKCPTCGSTPLTQDPDVLDTWFSSALWPFSTLGWPGTGGVTPPLLKTFYPTSVLVTAFDIIFFWVARMMMMGIHFMKEVPFKDVHIHAIVRDPLGQKMSKSKGNVIDPLILMQKYGTDAFRFTLSAFAAQGRDIKLDEARVEGYRNFCNKIWNASRFALMNAAPFIKDEKDFESVKPKHKINQWILWELSQTIEQTIAGIEQYEFNRSAQSLYTFFWQDFCDWYLEFTKEIYKTGSDDEKIESARTTYCVLDASLRLLHPFMPFITEEIWQILADRKNNNIVTANFPSALENKKEYETSGREMHLLIDMVGELRSFRQETGVPLTAEIDVWIKADKENEKMIQDVNQMMLRLARIRNLKFVQSDPSEPCAVLRAGGAVLFVPLTGLIDIEKYSFRLNKIIQQVSEDIRLLSAKLEDSRFVNHAPEELRVEKNQQLAEAQLKFQLLQDAMQLLQRGS